MVYLRAGLRNRRPNNLLRGIAGCTVFRWSAPLSVTPASRKTSVPENLSVLTSQGPPTRARVQAHRHVKTYRPQWIEQQIRESDFVLMVCTETYYRRVARIGSWLCFSRLLATCLWWRSLLVLRWTRSLCRIIEFESKNRSF